jgi:hypothetical protein
MRRCACALSVIREDLALAWVERGETEAAEAQSAATKTTAEIKKALTKLERVFISSRMST